MIGLRPVPLPDHCANLACHNRPTEGRFVLLEGSAERPLPGARTPLLAPVRLYVCAPCAEAVFAIQGGAR